MVHLPPSPFADTPQPRTLAEEVVAVARAQLGVRELRGHPNRGPEVDEYLRSVGLDPTKGSYAWCSAFVHWVYLTASANLGMLNPCPKRAGVLKLWDAVPDAARILGAAARDHYELVRPGDIFIMDKGKGLGHAGLVTARNGNLLATVEGNTDPGGSREGDGVYERERPIASMLGFVGFGR